MMQWIKSKDFVLSGMIFRDNFQGLNINYLMHLFTSYTANLHAGAVVASYPFDDSKSHRSGVYSDSPDDAFFKRVAR